MARVHAMAIEFIRHSDARFALQRLTRFVSAYQMVAPLTLGELWAWPSMLRLSLIENLRRLTDEVMESRAGAAQAEQYYARSEAIWPNGTFPPLRDTPPNGFVVQLLQRMRELGPRVSELRIALEGTLKKRDLRACNPFRSGPDPSRAAARQVPSEKRPRPFSVVHPTAVPRLGLCEGVGSDRQLPPITALLLDH
jgi:cyclic beta-1,2-glucan synthetase